MFFLLYYLSLSCLLHNLPCVFLQPLVHPLTSTTTCSFHLYSPLLLSYSHFSFLFSLSVSLTAYLISSSAIVSPFFNLIILLLLHLLVLVCCSFSYHILLYCYILFLLLCCLSSFSFSLPLLFVPLHLLLRPPFVNIILKRFCQQNCNSVSCVFIALTIVQNLKSQ